MPNKYTETEHDLKKALAENDAIQDIDSTLDIIAEYLYAQAQNPGWARRLQDALTAAAEQVRDAKEVSIHGY